MQSEEISLFPIPGSVSLPFSTVPLHVFEPRYRKMMLESIEANRRIGVAHTIRTISPAKTTADATTEELLSKNQDTYEAQRVFSAGFAEILETLPDGRMVVRIQMDGRFETLETVQQLPYAIVRAAAYEDATSAPVKDLRETLDALILERVRGRIPVLEKHLQSPEWKGLPDLHYSFMVYSMMAFDPEVLQKVLELRSPFERIEFLVDALAGHPVQ